MARELENGTLKDEVLALEKLADIICIFAGAVELKSHCDKSRSAAAWWSFIWKLATRLCPGHPLETAYIRAINQWSKSLCRLHVNPTKLFAHAIKDHDDVIALVASPAKSDFDSALAAMVSNKLFGVWERNEMSLNISVLELANADFIIAVILDYLNLVLVVAWYLLVLFSCP